ncbi:MAG: hemerythrin family protein [Thiothrix sp.]|uniref:bacteriohemerythrin n=1 Tax=Thiothrix sp. TaxID=1032 RepID=UPI002603A7C5|nr:hemerythrin family protein [Thiothrix sp.]MDD5395047.1 hemerythrin family protein [Thiothrix sp.]
MDVEEKFTDCSLLPQVAVPFMNTVHCEELLLVGKLLGQVESGEAPDTVDATLAAWVGHTEAHFAREERLMMEYNFFAYPVHQMAHEEALQQLQAVQQQWQASRDYTALTAYIREWREWLQQHVASMDFVTAHFLSQFNIQVEL